MELQFRIMLICKRSRQQFQEELLQLVVEHLLQLGAQAAVFYNDDTAMRIAGVRQAIQAGELPRDPASTEAARRQRLKQLLRHGWVVYANVLGAVLAVAVTAVGLADRRKDMARELA